MLFKDILLDYKINQTNKPVDLESLDELTDLMNTETVTWSS